MRLAGKSALITGGEGTLGSNAAREFVREGAHVFSLDLAAAKRPDSAPVRVPGRHTIHRMHADVRSAADWQRCVDHVLTVTGRIDVLVNIAAVSAYGSGSDEDQWQRIIDVNLKGAYLGAMAVLPAMIEAEQGSIVNVSSIVALSGFPGGHLAYTCAKAGLAAMTRALAVRSGPHGVRANTVYPGLMQPMAPEPPRSDENAAGALPAWTSAELNRNAVLEAVPLRREGTAADVVNALVYLASDESSYVTGCDLVVDGGYTAR